MTDTRDSLQSLIDAPLADQLWAELNHAIGYIAPTSLQGKAAREWVESLALRMNLVAKLKRDTALQSGAGDAQIVPAGWVLVPIEPNWDMRNEGREFLIDGLEKDYEKIAYFLWKTMVNASPKAPDTRPPVAGLAEWLPIADAPKDGTPVLLKFKDPLAKYNCDRGFDGLQFVGNNRNDAMQWGFAAPVGMGGFPDEWLEGWKPLDNAQGHDMGVV